MYLDKIKLHPEMIADKINNIKRLAKLTAGITGADIANISNQAVSHYINRKFPVEVPEYRVESLDGDHSNQNLNEESSQDTSDDGTAYNDVVKAIDEVIVGMEKRERLMSEKEKEIVAYHEAGHSLTAYILKDTEPPIKVSIIPRGDAALGYSMQQPIDKNIQQYEELLAQMCVLIGGRTAEQIVFKRISTGAFDDLQKMTQIVYKIVTVYGMSKRIGPINLLKPDDNISMMDKLSDQHREEIDTEVRKITEYVCSKTKQLLQGYRPQLDKLAKFLLEHEEITSEDISTLLENDNIKNIEEISLDDF